MSKGVKILIGIVSTVFYIATCVMALIVGSVDQGEVDGLYEMKATSIWNQKDRTCQMPGCANRASVRLSHKIETQYERHGNLNIENKANFNIVSNTTQHVETDTYVKKDEYLLIQGQGDGSYRVSQEEEWNEYTVEGDTFDHYITHVYGDYCSDHKDEAREIMIGELKTAIQSTPIYIWGKTLFPYNLIVFTALLAFVIGFCGKKSWYIDIKEYSKPLLVCIVATIVCALWEADINDFICELIEYEYAGTVLFVAAVVASAGFALVICHDLGVNLAKKKKDKEAPIEAE